MSGFEFLFSFYGLLLGLAVANVATGFADIWRSRTDIAPGWSTPLLGLFILLAAAQQWVSFWGGRDNLTMSPATLLISILVAFPYIFVSQGMFPRTQDRWASLEDYYIEHRRVLLGALLVPPLASIVYNFVQRGSTPQGTYAAYLAVRILLPTLLMLTANRWINRIGLMLLSMTMLAAIFLFFR